VRWKTTNLRLTLTVYVVPMICMSVRSLAACKRG
jgi:hypothetical protein